MTTHEAVYRFVPDDYSGTTMTLNQTCIACGESYQIIVEQDKYFEWTTTAAYVQNVFSTITPSQREMLISGTHPDCFQLLFPPDDDEL